MSSFKMSFQSDENGNSHQQVDNHQFDTNNNQQVDTNLRANVSEKEASSGPRELSHPDCDEWQLVDVEDRGSHGGEQQIGQAGSVREFVEIEPAIKRDKYTDSFIFACTLIYALMPLASLITTILLASLIFTKFYLITMVYYSYIVLNRKVCNSGGVRFRFIYEAKFWAYLAAYFPIRLRFSKTFKLDPNENYILNYSPHGISAFGSVVSFATNGLNFSKLFPGIRARFMVHETSFLVPVMRETFLYRGDCSVNSASIDYMLSQPSKGNLLTIVVGGLAEADLSDPQVLKIVVANRKGFIKKALVHQAHIIPCIAFGENSVFTKINHEAGSSMHKLESLWYKLFQFKHPLYFGRGIFSDKVNGVMPYKRPITVVMGDPIIVENLIESPSQKDIDDLHERYLKELQSLYNSNQDLRSEYDTTMVLV